MNTLINQYLQGANKGSFSRIQDLRVMESRGLNMIEEEFKNLYGKSTRSYGAQVPFHLISIVLLFHLQ